MNGWQVNGWQALLLAGVFEITWAIGLKYSAGLTRLWPTLAMIVALGLSFVMMSLALKSIPFGTAYAIWTGIGAAGAILVGIFLFGEPADVFRMSCLILIVVGMVGLRLASTH
jgi:quaternary ammonium compound-resistance protein SugE